MLKSDLNRDHVVALYRAIFGVLLARIATLIPLIGGCVVLDGPVTGRSRCCPRAPWAMAYADVTVHQHSALLPERRGTGSSA
jgi:hypothetical protein